MIREFYLDGRKIHSEKGFYSEIERELLVDSSVADDWSLEVFDDIFYGGYGVYDLSRAIRIIWRNYRSSEEKLNSLFLKEVFQIIDAHKNIELVLD